MNGKRTNRNQGNLGQNLLISILVCFAVINLTSTTVAAVYELEFENIHDIHKSDSHFSLKEIFEKDNNRVITKEYSKEFVITFDFTIEELARDGQVFNRLCLINGGIECGSEGEERQFYKYNLKVQGELNSIFVTFMDPIVVSAAPTPYRIPLILGQNDEVLSHRWKGYLDNDVEVTWVNQHLSKATIDGSTGQLYSLKLYPVEYRNQQFESKTTVLFKKAKISYYATEYCYWSLDRSEDSDGVSTTVPNPVHKPIGAVKYLIITHSDLLSSVNSFAEWKSQKGLFTQVMTTDEINEMYDDSEGDIQYKMRKYIQQLEQKYDLDYLFLVGDWDKVPTRNTKNSYSSPMMGEPNDFASDLYFACVDPNTTWNKDGDADYAEDGELDDCVPDMAVGRLASNSPSEISSILEHLIAREKNLTYDPMHDVAVYMAGDPGYMPGDPTEVMDHFYNIYGKNVFSNNFTIYYDNTGKLEYTSNSVEKVLNDHHTVMCYFGHGQPTGFPELFENSDIANLQNNGTDGTLFAMACLTGWFDDPRNSGMMGAVENCFAELLTETPGKGLVGVIASSRMAVGYIDTVYSDDAPGLEEDYWRSVRDASNGNLTPAIGAVWRDAITNFAGSFFPFKSQGFDNPGLRTFLEYNLLGEPEAPLIFHRPEILNIEYSLDPAKTTIQAKVTNITGAPVSSATVCIYRADELGRVYNTNGKGEVTFNIPPNNGGDINITASRPGDIPASDSFSLPDSLAPKSMYSLDPEEPDGNNGYYISYPNITLFGDEQVDVEYRIDTNDTMYHHGPTTVKLTSGEHTVEFRVKDRAGHCSDWTVVRVMVDDTAPELNVKLDPSKPDGNACWYVTRPILTIHSNEKLNDSYYSLNDGELNKYGSPIVIPEGEYEIKIIAFDLAGNMNTTELTLKVDLTAPNSQINISHQPDGENGYYIIPPTVTLLCQDEPMESVSLEYRWDAGTWKIYQTPIVPPEGSHSLYYRGIDIAGNVELEHISEFLVDTEMPEVNIDILPSQPDGLNGYYKTYPIVEISSEDGIVYYYLMDAAETYTNRNGNAKENENANFVEVHDNIVIPDGEWYLYSIAVDDAGNRRNGEPRYFKVDTRPPVLSWEIIPNTPEGDNLWYSSSPEIRIYSVIQNEDVTIYWSLNDDNEWIEYNQETGIILPSGEYTLRLRGVDLAGNIYLTETQAIKVDMEAPEITITTPAEGQTTGRTVLVNWKGADELAGIECYKVRLDEKDWNNMYNETSLELENLNNGEHKVAIRAWDRAGNSIQVKRSFIVDAEEPKIRSRTPIGQNIPVDTIITIEFSEEMDTTSVEVTLTGITGRLRWENNTAIFIPDQELKFDMKYSIHITGADQYGNQLGEYTWSFRTMPEPEQKQESGEKSFFDQTMGSWIAGMGTSGVVVAIIVIFSSIIIVALIITRRSLLKKK